MSAIVQVEELLTYSEYERAKWRDWIAADPARLDIPFQPGGRFPTVGAQLDHMFLAERRSLARLEGGTPPEQTGVPAGDWQDLFEFADLVRAELRRYIADLDESRATEPITITLAGSSLTMTRHKLIVHIAVHEIRHFAQIAFAARAAGHAPPGEHDLLFCPALA